MRNEALPEERMRAVETGGCPHAAIREVRFKDLKASFNNVKSEMHCPPCYQCL